MDENECSVISDIVRERLEYTQSIRKLIVKELTNNGQIAPSGSKDVEALNAVLDSIDKNEFERIKLDIKNNANKMENSLKTTIAEIYKNIAAKQYTNIPTNRNVELPNEFVPDDIKPGEDFVGQDPLDKNDFM